LAPFALIGEECEPEAGYWFLAQPVHFVLQRDFFSLGGAVRLGSDETALLAVALNQHFAQDGLRFVPSKASDCLYLHVNEDVDVSKH